MKILKFILSPITLCLDAVYCVFCAIIFAFTSIFVVAALAASLVYIAIKTVIREMILLFGFVSCIFSKDCASGLSKTRKYIYFALFPLYPFVFVLGLAVGFIILALIEIYKHFNSIAKTILYVVLGLVALVLLIIAPHFCIGIVSMILVLSLIDDFLD